MLTVISPGRCHVGATAPNEEQQHFHFSELNLSELSALRVTRSVLFCRV